MRHRQSFGHRHRHHNCLQLNSQSTQPVTKNSKERRIANEIIYNTGLHTHMHAHITFWPICCAYALVSYLVMTGTQTLLHIIYTSQRFYGQC